MQIQFRLDSTTSRNKLIKHCIAYVCFIYVCASCFGYGYAGTLFPYSYTHYSEKEKIADLLTDFARTQGYASSISPSIRGTISGRFENENPYKFLEGIKTAFGVSWYVLGRTIHFYLQTEAQRVFISPKIITVDRMYNMLITSDVLSAQLPAHLMENGKMIVLYGPPEYTDQVSRAVAAFEASQMSNVVMRVFPLKHAWADDITINSMDKSITVPGIASILRAMVSGSHTQSLSTVVEHPATVNKLSGKGLVSKGKSSEEDTSSKKGNGKEQAVVMSSIMADPRMNAVIVNDSAYKMPYYKEVIRDLDKPLALVEIHAAIVDIDSNYKRELGVAYQGDYTKNKTGVGGDFSTKKQTVPIKPIPGSFEGAGISLSTIYTLGLDYFMARVKALESVGEARVLGRPSVLTVDNVQATLENTSTYYIQVEGYQAVDLFKVEAGTILRVTPHIINNRNCSRAIKLVVSVEDNQNDTEDPKGSSSTVIPPIKQTKINTQAVIGTGQSLLIGGYYYEQKQKEESGIPVLMSIPVLGHLFKTTTITTKQMERLILITPKIVSLNDLPSVPKHVDDLTFHRSATQSNYKTIPTKYATGCSKNSTLADREKSVQAKNKEAMSTPRAFRRRNRQ